MVNPQIKIFVKLFRAETENSVYEVRTTTGNKGGKIQFEIEKMRTLKNGNGLIMNGSKHYGNKIEFKEHGKYTCLHLHNNDEFIIRTSPIERIHN